MMTPREFAERLVLALDERRSAMAESILSTSLDHPSYVNRRGVHSGLSWAIEKTKELLAEAERGIPDEEDEEED